MINLNIEARDDSVYIKALNYKGRTVLIIELPKGFFRVSASQNVIACVQKSIREFSQKNSIPPHEIFLVSYYFDCRTKIYSDIKENFPECFL